MNSYRDTILADRPRAYWPLDDRGIINTATSLRINGSIQNLSTSPAAITGDLEIVSRVSMDNWNATNQILFSKDNNVSRTWQWNVGQGTAGQLRWYWWDSGNVLRQLDYGTAFNSVMTNGVTYWIRFRFDVDNGSGGATMTLWYAADQGSEPASWTQLGSPATFGSTTSILAGTDALSLGDTHWNAAASANIKYFALRNGFGGSDVANFDALIVSPITSATPTSIVQSINTWTLASGATWAFTLNTLCRDISGHGYDATYTITVGFTYSVGSPRSSGNRGILFNNNLGYIQPPSASRQTVTDFSRECWVKTTSLTSQFLVGQYGGVDGEDWWFLQADGRYTMSFYNSGYITNGGAPLSNIGDLTRIPQDGRVHHLVLTRANGGFYRVFRDGYIVAEAAGGTSASTLLSTSNNGIGKAIPDGNQFFIGTMSDVAIYDYALSPSQVFQHFSVGAGIGYKSVSHSMIRLR